jgi:hypothetical protein
MFGSELLPGGIDIAVTEYEGSVCKLTEIVISRLNNLNVNHKTYGSDII